MAAFFLDTGTVLKRYVLETGTAWVQALVAPALRHSLFVVRITLAETVAAITRRERGGSITPHDAATAPLRLSCPAVRSTMSHGAGKVPDTRRAR